MKNLLINCIKFYQIFLSFPGVCRYRVSCSEYTKQVISEYGVLKGVWMGFNRILRCNPWN